MAGIWVIVMAPPCTPFGSWANYNRWRNADAWRRSYNDCAPIARLCGDIALYQVQHRRGFVNEQPAGSKLYAEQPWPIVAQQPGVCCVLMDQRATNLRSSRGIHMRKRSEVWASDEVLLRPLVPLQCPGNHQHQHVQGSETANAKYWTWEFATAITQGVVAFLRKHSDRSTGGDQSYHPVTASTWRCTTSKVTAQRRRHLIH